jgi:pimeloyl-ACP methyl ester carboxylesterase
MLQPAQAVVEGQTIAYATEGAGPSLLLLHGLGFDHRGWAAAAPYLAGHFRLLIPDLPGFGRSKQIVWDGSPDVMTRLVGGFLTATQAVPTFVAGAGLGGTLGLLLAARFPERVRAVIAIGAPALTPWPATGQARLLRSALAIPGLTGLLAQIAPQAHAARFVRDSVVSSEPPAEAVAIVTDTLRDTATRQTLIRSLGRLNAWRATSRSLKGVRSPTLLIWGERDALYGLPTAERLRHAIPGAQLVTLPGAGHALTIERPADLAATIRQYLAPLVRR